LAVKVFCGESFSEYENEWRQFKELYSLIKEKYDDKEEPVYLIGNVETAMSQIQKDYHIVAAQSHFPATDKKEYPLHSKPLLVLVRLKARICVTLRITRLLASARLSTKTNTKIGEHGKYNIRTNKR